MKVCDPELCDCDPSNFCIGWGKIRPGEGNAHMDCPVVLTEDTVYQSAISAELLTNAKQFPMVCPCECQTCKRAWWAKGRPILKDGKIVTSPE